MLWKNLITQHFPDAWPSGQIVEEIQQKLKHDYQVDLQHFLLGDCRCIDDLVRSDQMAERLAGAGIFSLGGLAGFPATGKTGFLSFGDHVPDRGTAVILYGPHIGVSELNGLGTVRRFGHLNETTCCGSLIGILNRMQQTDQPRSTGKASQSFDMQQVFVERQLFKHRSAILKSANPVLEITEIAYKLARRQISHLVKATGKQFRGKPIVLVGGIYVNTKFGEEDWFDLRHCDQIPLR
jgi:hypothetical protein